MSLYVVGDVHRKLDRYFQLLHRLNGTVIQVGDLGYRDEWNRVDRFPGTHYFIHGNHDEVEEENRRYLGPFGLFVVDGPEFYFVSGAETRYPLGERKKKIGINWWPSREELTNRQMEDAVAYYLETRPQLVISHDCPARVKSYLLGGRSVRDRTSSCLQTMLEEHTPKLWVFGHLHQEFQVTFDKTDFVCVPELGVVKIKEDLSWSRLPPG